MNQFFTKCKDFELFGFSSSCIVPMMKDEMDLARCKNQVSMPIGGVA